MTDDIDAKPTFLETQPLRVARLGAGVYRRVQLTKKAFERGRELGKALKPVLRAQVDVQVNIAQLYGIRRLELIMGEEHAKLEAFQQQQAVLHAEYERSKLGQIRPEEVMQDGRDCGTSFGSSAGSGTGIAS